MNTIIREVRSQKSDLEPHSIGEGLVETSRFALTSNLGLRGVNPCLVNAAIE